jgi:hypothetical protein
MHRIYKSTYVDMVQSSAEAAPASGSVEVAGNDGKSAVAARSTLQGVMLNVQDMHISDSSDAEIALWLAVQALQHCGVS